MNHIYLCGHTGSINRGCEAILRGSAQVLKQSGAKGVSALTFDKNYDESLQLNKAISLIPYPKKSFPIRVVGKLRRKLMGDGIWGSRYYYYPLFKRIEKSDIIFNVGGDTYCYRGMPHISFALNELAANHNIPNIFWGCSVEENVLSNAALKEDINRYSFIVARETLSYDILKKCITEPEKVFLACDPAFHLPVQKTELPEPWNNNMLALNISPLMFLDTADDNDMMYKNIRHLIDFILAETTMNICLVPHVYNIEKNLQDIAILKRIHSWYSESGRVAIIDRELSCTQLKFIISQCRFFIGARTHATIAAYSSGVPAIALSYSIKSRGLARDLFGTDEGYAISWKNLSDEGDLKTAFENILLKNESDIRDRYAQILPQYKESLIEVTKKILEKVSLENE